MPLRIEVNHPTGINRAHFQEKLRISRRVLAQPKNNSFDPKLTLS